MSESIAPRAIAIVTTLSALGTAFVILRCVSRFVIVKRSNVDDFLIIVATVMSWAFSGLIIGQAHYGLGRHYDTLVPGEFTKMMKLFWASIIFYNLGLTSTKLSILFQFLRFFITTKTRRATWALVGIVGTYGFVVIIVAAWSCRPVNFFWDRTIEGGKCVNLLAFWYSNAAFNIVTDMALVALPINVFKDLQLPRKQKWALLGVFALGGFSCVTSILRLHSIYVVAGSTDITWDNTDAAMWSSIELNTAIMCACLPAMRPLITAVAPKIFVTNSGASSATVVEERSVLGVIRKTMDIEVDAMHGHHVSPDRRDFFPLH